MATDDDYDDDDDDDDDDDYDVFCLTNVYIHCSQITLLQQMPLHSTVGVRACTLTRVARPLQSATQRCVNGEGLTFSKHPAREGSSPLPTRLMLGLYASIYTTPDCSLRWVSLRLTRNPARLPLDTSC